MTGTGTLPHGCFSQLICPTGSFSEFLSSPFIKNISLFPNRDRMYQFAVPPQQEGRIAIVTNVERDAMDAWERMTSADRAYGKVVWSRSPDAGIKPVA
jgi:hypothetical protein